MACQGGMDGCMDKLTYRWTNIRTDGQTEARTEFLPILQDFIPCWAHCPKKRASVGVGEKQRGERVYDFYVLHDLKHFRRHMSSCAISAT